MEKVRIEGLSSLKLLQLRLASIEESSFANMNSLQILRLAVEDETIDKEILAKLFEICPNIEELDLDGQFSNINFDRFVNLKSLSLNGHLLDDFNFDLFKNICNRLEELWIEIDNLNDESMSKLICNHDFPNLLSFIIRSSEMTRLEKKLFDRFRMLQSLEISNNDELKTIDKDAFSNLNELEELDILDNFQLSKLDPELYSCLEKLQLFNRT